MKCEQLPSLQQLFQVLATVPRFVLVSRSLFSFKLKCFLSRHSRFIFNDPLGTEYARRVRDQLGSRVLSASLLLAGKQLK